MKVLVTGYKGFIGKNLIEFLKTKPNIELYLFDIENTAEDLNCYCKDCDFVVNLAGVNRNPDDSQFVKGNCGVIENVINYLIKNQNICPIMYSSSIQAELDNIYGKSKKLAEDIVFNFSNKYNVPVYVYRFPNLFGKWGLPNYNSVIATFCYNISRDIEIQINDANKELTLAYIDDVVSNIYDIIMNRPDLDDKYCNVDKIYQKKLGDIANLIYQFKNSRKELSVINTGDDFEKKLYSTYLSFLPTDQFSYEIKSHVDERGSFSELIRTSNAGQFSVNIAKPGITKGNHWHNTKNEKFIVIKGNAEICFREPFSSEIIKYYVCGDKIEVVDIPCGYTHNIKNIGNDDLIFFIWCNECYDINNPDTYFLEV